MSFFKILLLPFAMLYDLVTDLRNRMYDMKWKPSAEFDFPVIGVGNLAVGGTGKTPMVEYLIRLLSPKMKVATLSRGYGRKTRGLRFASGKDTALTIGDEPLQLYKKYGSHVAVSVCEERAFAIPHILDQHPGTKVILMDDAFQHRKVKPGFSILLTEYSRPFYEDHVLPYGRLREGPEGAMRTDVIVVTKCPTHTSEESMIEIEKKIRQITLKPVYFSTIRYGEPRPFFNATQEPAKQVVLVSGIAHHELFEQHIRKTYDVLRHFVFRDHHFYSAKDLKEIETFLRQQDKAVSVITTEKDMAKLEDEKLKPYISRWSLFYLPIEMEFVRSGKDFDALVLDFINRVGKP
jgi:tetraacyldisaccharide 4'-kinase